MKGILANGRIFSVILIGILFGCRFEGAHGNNHAPDITSLPNTLAITSEPYIYVVKARDRDGDLLTYTLENHPEGMSINSATGEINWLPTLRQVGNHLIEARVTDGSAGDSQSFAVRVSPLDNGVPFQRGFTLVSWWHDSYLQPQTAESLARLREDGCEWVSILVTWYQDNINTTTIFPWDLVTPSDEAIIHAIDIAHSLGMNVVLKPHIDTLSGIWRGNISFSTEADWQTWFDNYNQFLGHYLDLAQANNVQAVIIGTELMKTESREADWRNTISLARAKFSGLLTYDANHSSFFLVNWWDDLDFIGISAYFPLTSGYSPTVEELKSEWARIIRPLAAFAALYDKDIVFTEIGYVSRDGTNILPYDYQLATDPDLQEQADCYQAALESLFDETWFKGMYWWAWSWDPGTDNNGYDIYNKPAESILRHWYAGY
jgi:hypothetical protein